MAVEDEVAVIFCGVHGLLESVPADKVSAFETSLLQLLHANYSDTVLAPLKAGKLTDEASALLTEAAKQVAAQF